jgi:hypothetical protein
MFAVYLELLMNEVVEMDILSHSRCKE